MSKKKNKNKPRVYEPKHYMKNFGYNILETLSVAEGIEHILSIPKNKSFSRKHVLADLAAINTTCVCCGCVGTKFGLGQGKYAGEKNRGDDKHWDLYTDNDTALSIDHIHPRSLGGINHISNCQLMCIKCNNVKGNKPNRLIAYKHLLDLGYNVEPMMYAGLGFMIVENFIKLPADVIEPIKHYIIEDYSYFNKFVYFFNDKPQVEIVE